MFSILQPLVDFAVPPVCPICRRALPPVENGPARCSLCARAIPHVDNYCSRCSAPLGPHLRSDFGCHHCRADRFAFEAAVALGEYRDELRRGILSAKRRGGEAASAWLADRLWDRRQAELKQWPIDIATAVPQHWQRRLRGPHNAAELIGRRLAGRLKVSFRPSILVKTRRTPSQTSLPPTARRENLRRAFHGSREIAGLRIVLADDVMTTGTTAHRAARALREAGAEAVWVAVIARGLGR